MTETRCPVTELIVSQCGCRAHRRETAPVSPDPADPFDTPAYVVDGPGPWVPAQWPGYCDTCGDMFIQDDYIRADGSGGWQARNCCG